MTIDAAIVEVVSGPLVSSLVMVAAVAVAVNKSIRAGQIWSLIATAGTAEAEDTVVVGDTEIMVMDDVIITVSLLFFILSTFQRTKLIYKF